MSTTQAPDPREFNSWEDAFQYPVPVVRRLEQQLRSNIDENRDKLRSLVGSSYRDLLGTAERIVDMDGQMHAVESQLSGLGQKCNARALEKIASSHQRDAKAQRDRIHGRNALASNIALLQSCLKQTARTIKQGDSPLQAAKLLVLARLLYTSAAKSPNPPALLDNLKTRLGSLRRKLLSHVDTRLASTNLEKSALVETLSALSLTTTSTPTDVLNHFLRMRATGLGDILHDPSEKDLHSSLDLLIATLKEVQAVFPKQLSTLLGRLQDVPILQDSSIRDMAELNLDVYERWIADDVRNFTPWLRHDQLQIAVASKTLKEWVKQAKSLFLKGLRTLLATMQDASVIMELRKHLLARSLSADRKLPGLDPSNFFEDLRSCIITRLRELAVDTTTQVSNVVASFLNDKSPEEESFVSLWDPANTEIELGKGAINFRNLICDAHQGKGDKLQALEKSLTDWSSKLATFSSTIKAMREDRWNDELDLDIEDDFKIDSPQDMLAREDPQELQKLLFSEKEKALATVFEKVHSTFSALEDTDRAATLLRLLREVVRKASSIEMSTSGSKPPQALFEALHKALAEQVMRTSNTQKKKSSRTTGLFTRAPATAIWEGYPLLPVQPSTACFRYLHETCKNMKDMGSDLWTPPAVAMLKTELRNEVVGCAKTIFSSKEYSNSTTKPEKETTIAEDGTTTEPSTEAIEESKPSPGIEDAENLKSIQAVFDLLYLDKILALPAKHKGSDGLNDTVEEIASTADLDDVAVERLRKSSVDYYKRTYLLFGLFAVG